MPRAGPGRPPWSSLRTTGVSQDIPPGPRSAASTWPRPGARVTPPAGARARPGRGRAARRTDARAWSPAAPAMAGGPARRAHRQPGPRRPAPALRRAGRRHRPSRRETCRAGPLRTPVRRYAEEQEELAALRRSAGVTARTASHRTRGAAATRSRRDAGAGHRLRPARPHRTGHLRTARPRAAPTRSRTRGSGRPRRAGPRGAGRTARPGRPGSCRGCVRCGRGPRQAVR